MLGLVNARTRKVLEEALELSAEDRALLATALEASLEDEDDQESSPEEVAKDWAQELEARIEEVVAGRVVARDASEVLAELRARYARR